MRRALVVAAAAAVGTLAFVSAPAQAACHYQTSQHRDSQGHVTGRDTVMVLPEGSVLYSDGATYAGVTGPNGTANVLFGGAAANTTVWVWRDGTPVDVRVGAPLAPHVCVNDIDVP